MIDACRANGVQLMACYYQRYNSRHQQIRQLLAEGAIRQVTTVRLNFSDYFPPTPGFWHHNPAISGGGCSWIWAFTASISCAISAAR
jgi:predicted dehydrogenase